MIERVRVNMATKSDTKKKTVAKATTAKKATTKKASTTKKVATTKKSTVTKKVVPKTTKKVETPKVEVKKAKWYKHPLVTGILAVVVCYFLGYLVGSIVRLIVG